MGNKETVARSDLGIKPWFTFEEIQDKLQTGDIILFSTKSFPGRLLRFHTTSKYSHVGIIIKLKDHNYILESSINYLKLIQLNYNLNDTTLMSHFQLTKLQSKIYSNYYDLISIRQMKYNSNEILLKIQERFEKLLFEGNVPLISYKSSNTINIVGNSGQSLYNQHQLLPSSTIIKEEEEKKRINNEHVNNNHNNNSSTTTSLVKKEEVIMAPTTTSTSTTFTSLENNNERKEEDNSSNSITNNNNNMITSPSVSSTQTPIDESLPLNQNNKLELIHKQQQEEEEEEKQLKEEEKKSPRKSPRKEVTVAATATTIINSNNNNTINNNNDSMTLKKPLLLSSIEFTLLPYYFNNYFKESLFDNAFIFQSPVEDQQLLISANVTAFILNQIGIFQINQMSIITKFIAKHFGEENEYKLPFNKEIVMGLLEPIFIYQDYQLFADEINVQNKPLPPDENEFPICDKIIRNNLFLNMELFYQLRTGDLIFFQRKDTIHTAIRRVWCGSKYSRVGIIVRLNNIPFVYDISPYYLHQKEEIREKILEGRMISLFSYLHSNPFTLVSVKRLDTQQHLHNGGNLTFRFQEKKATIQMSLHIKDSSLNQKGSFECPFEKKIKEVLENVDGSFMKRIRFDVSGILSCVFVLAIFKQLGLITVTDNLPDLLSYTPNNLLEFTDLNNNLALGEETTLLTTSL
ncbi:hypothetical protein ABK040_007513 [Willaertia magna]